MSRKLSSIAIVALLLAGVIGCNQGPKPGEEITPEQLADYADVPLYPNAKAPDAASQVPEKDASGDMRYDLVQITGESPQGVAQWYEKKLGWTAQGSNSNWNLMGAQRRATMRSSASTPRTTRP